MSTNAFMEKIGEKAKFASLNLSRLNINKKNTRKQKMHLVFTKNF